MNKIWIFIILISIIFGLLNGNANIMITELFNVPEKTLLALFKIGSMLVIYNGLFTIAIKSQCIAVIARPFNKIIKKLFIKIDDETIDLISASVICNLLGLGPANMTMAIKVIDKLRFTEKKDSNLALYLLINISSLCILPLSTLALRSTFNSFITIEFVPMLFLSSLLTTVFAILLCKVFYRE